MVCAGLNAAVAAKAFAASRVAITDIRADNFAVAEQVSASPALLDPAQLQEHRGGVGMQTGRRLGVCNSAWAECMSLSSSRALLLAKSAWPNLCAGEAKLASLCAQGWTAGCMDLQPASTLLVGACPPPHCRMQRCSLSAPLTAGLCQTSMGPKCRPAQVGVSSALLTPPSLSPARIAEELFKLLPPHGPDVVIDCAGFDSTLQVSSLAALHTSALSMSAATPATRSVLSIEW